MRTLPQDGLTIGDFVVDKQRVNDCLERVSKMPMFKNEKMTQLILNEIVMELGS